MDGTGVSPGAGRRWLRRPEVQPWALNLLVAIYLLATCNLTFWGKLAGILADDPVSMAIVGLAAVSLTFLVVTLPAVRRLQRPVLAFLVILASVTSFYQDRLGVMIDRDMVQNALTTTMNEGRHLVTAGFALHFGLRAVPGLFLVFWPRLRRAPPLRAALGWAGLALGAAAVTVGLLASDLKNLSTTLRGRRDLVGSLQPLAPLTGTLRYIRMMTRAGTVTAQPFGRDAVKGALLAAESKPVLLVIVAGETARAQNWSLGGYERDTNPELARRDILYYSDVTSCASATATALPCMFSPLTRSEYSYEAGLGTENLLDVLSHAGFHVEWWDNNTGDKHVADRLDVHMMDARDDAAACAAGECTDAVFLPRLRALVESMTQDTVVVLHQIGSHGPSYWLRYPPGDEVFTPACHTEELGDCTNDEIVNAYDNTIRFTDRFLASVIDLLGASGRIVPAMIYVSDHGESLGEGGLYLHGAPWYMAPAEQVKVPMVLWLSPAFRATLGLDAGCLAARRAEPLSHDNLFSTVLGLLDIDTSVRDAALDLSEGCRRLTG